MKKRFRAEDAIRMVREAEALLAQGRSSEEACRQLGISESSLVRWRHKYGGLGTPEARRLKELEHENRELKQLVAELELDRRILKSAMKHLGKA